MKRMSRRSTCGSWTFPGLWQHFTIPVSKLDEDVFEDGLGFDGSSIRGWQAINESDMLVVPQPETAFLDPFTELPTLVMICNIQDPITREDYSRDPRNVARKAVNYLKSTGIADTAYFRPGGGVLHLRRHPLRPERSTKASTTSTASKVNGTAVATKNPNLGYKLRHKEGYFPVPPADQMMDHPQRDDADDDRLRAGRRMPAPRGGHGRSGGNRPASSTSW